MTKPRVSVLMTVYNGQPFLCAAVDSILSQTLTDFEFIIINDGSTDETAAILQQYALHDRRVQVVNLPENIGLARAHNVGLNMAQGEYLALQDADDISMPNRLHEETALLDGHPELGLVGIVPDLIDDEGAPLGRERRFTTKNPDLQAQLLSDCCFCHGSLLLRRSLLARAGPYDPGMEPADDYDLMLRMAEVSEITNIDAGLYQYRVYASSVSRRREAYVIERAGLALERAAYRRYGAEPPSGSLNTAATYYLRAAVIAHLADNPALAEASLVRARALWPAIFDNAEPLSQTLTDRISGQTIDARLRLSRSVFEDLLPATPGLGRLRRHFEARLHMQEVFATWGRCDFETVRPHLWAGVRAEPLWLFNRGVLSYLSKVMFQRGRRHPPLPHD